MKAQAAVAHGSGFVIQDIDLDEPRDDEVLVAIAGVGLCHTDLVFAEETGFLELPAVLGHEGSGVVQAVGSNVTKVGVGDRVAMSFRSCGGCDRCASGDPAYCRTMPLLNYTGKRDDGSKSIRDETNEISGNFFGQSSFANLALSYERNLVLVPDDVPLELMGPLGCGIQTGVGSVLRSLKATPGSSLLIIGGGSVGLSAVMGAAIAGCSPIILAEPMANRRTLAQELGATHVIDPTAVDMVGAVRELVGFGVDYALDTTGIPAVQEAVLGALGSKGVFGVVGVAPPGTKTPGDVGTLMTFGHTIKGIIEGDSDPDEFIPELIGYYKAGQLPLEKLIRTYPLADINRAVAEQASGDCVKPILIP